MTASLLSSLIRMGILILAPWLVFSKNDKEIDVVGIEEKQVLNHAKKQKSQKQNSEHKGDIPVHRISCLPEEFENNGSSKVTEQLVEYCSIAADVFTVCWLALCFSLRSVCSKICLSLKPKQMIAVEPTMVVQDFNSDEIKILQAYESAPVIDGLLNHGLPASSRVKQAVPDLFLLQFTSLLDDTTAQKCLEDLGHMYAPGGKHGLFGTAEKNGWLDMPWEKRVNKQKPGVTFTMDRKYLRGGLYIYRSTAVFKYAKVEDFRHFILDSTERLEWDWSTFDLKRLNTETEAAEVQGHSESGFIYTENKMPGPISNREYVAARRVWSRADGGCYSITKSALHPLAPPRKGRNVRVDDYSSAFMLRPLTSVNGEKMDAVEMTSLYFDNAKMQPMAYNIAMSKSMWVGIGTTNTGFRKFQANRYPVQNSEIQEDGVEEYPDPLQLQETIRPGNGNVVALFGFAAVFCLVSVVRILPLQRKISQGAA